jgi:hypothetical protein
MLKNLVIASGTLMPEVMIMTEDRPAILDNLPTSVKGFCFHDNDGEAFIVLNARLTWEQNRRTYDHEKRHIDRGDMYDATYNEYGGGSP